LRRPERYAFTQAVRLLRLWANPRTARDLDLFLRDRLRFRPALSLGFAVSDVAALEVAFPDQAHAGIAGPEHQPFDKARITATFLGLYGASSPLPKFYTERLLDELAEDGSVIRDFLDIFNSQFFLLHALISSYAHPLHRRVSGYDPKAGRMLMALASYGDDSLCDRLPDEQIFLRYAGLFFQRTRTASGLRAILADASGCARTRIGCNAIRLARIPLPQRFCLGRSSSMLGEEATLGDAVPCYEGKIVIEFDALNEKTLRGMLPKSRMAGILHALIRNYCRQPLEYAVMARLLPNEAHAVRLGGDEAGRFASLGFDAWIGFGGTDLSAPLPAVNADFPAGFA
jgi:type VI secretion system protein ImpH